MKKESVALDVSKESTPSSRKKAFVFFGIVDLKYNERGEIYILEFARAFQSALNGYNKVYRYSGHDMFVSWLSKFTGLDVWVKHKSNTLLCSKSTKYILQERLFDPKTIKKKEDFDPCNITTYSALHCFGIESLPIPDHVLRVDYSADLHIILENKDLTHRCFEKAGMLHYRPKCLIIERKYSPTLADAIKRAMPKTKRFVLKLPDMERGEGVFLASREDLEAILERGLAPEIYFKKLTLRSSPTEIRKLLTSISSGILSEEDRRFSNWLNSTSDKFLVEEYTASKPIMKSGKLYDPTMRCVFAIINGHPALGRFSCLPMGGYWKFPADTLSGGYERKSRVSSFGSEPRASAVSADDLKKLTEKLKACLPKIIETMLNMNLYADACVQLKKKKGTVSWHTNWVMLTQLASVYGTMGFYSKAEGILKHAVTLDPTNSLGYREYGILLYKSGLFNQSVKSLDKAVELSNKDGILYLHRAKSHLMLGQFALARLNFNYAAKLGTSPLRVSFAYSRIPDETVNKFRTFCSKGAS